MLPSTIKDVALRITGLLFEVNPQKYNPESVEFTCLIVSFRVTESDDMLNFPLLKSLWSVTLESELLMLVMLLTLGPSLSLNQKTCDRQSVKLAHCRVTSSPGRTFRVRKPQAEEKSVKKRKEKRTHLEPY